MEGVQLEVLNLSLLYIFSGHFGEAVASFVSLAVVMSLTCEKAFFLSSYKSPPV